MKSLSTVGTIALVATLFAVTSCGRKTGYVYYTPPAATGQAFSAVQKIKDLQGNADVDILMVIDNSPSMDPYQKSVSANTSLFIDTLTQGTALRWKLGLISTSSGENPYIGFTASDILTYQDPDAASKFKVAISKLGTSGDGVERAYDSVLNAIKNNPDFIRPRADLVIMLVSDAPEQSTISSQDFVNVLAAMKGMKSKVFFYGVLDPSDWCPSTDDPFVWAGNKFDELLHIIKGSAYKICDANFGQNLTDIANKVVKQALSPRLYLKTRPKVETLNVVFHGKSLPGGPKELGGFWIYDFDQNAVVFHDLSFAPGDLEQVQVTYQEDVDQP